MRRLPLELTDIYRVAAGLCEIDGLLTVLYQGSCLRHLPRPRAMWR